MATSTILLENYEENVQAFFSSSREVKKVSKYISDFVDRHSEELFYIAPTKRLQFTMEGPDGEIILNALQVRPREMTRVIRSIKSIRNMADVLKSPVLVGITLMLREATIRSNKDPKDKKMETFRDQLMMYLVFALYWSLQYRQFKYEPNEALVRYTVNNLTNKFLFKTEGHVYGALYVTATNNHENAKDKLVSRDDRQIMEYIMDIRTRVSNLLIRFTREVAKNSEDEKYLNTVSDSYEEEDFYEVENVSGSIANITTDVLSKFSQGSVNRKILRIAAKYGDVPEGRLREVLIGIGKDEPRKVEEIIQGILMNFVNSGGDIKDVGGRDFIAESLKILNKSNVKDEHVIRVKDNLDYFLEKYSRTFANSNRRATKNSYRRALLTYMSLFIAAVVNG